MKREVALISGGGSGIGRAIALRLAARGATIGILDRDPSGAEGTVTLVQQAGGRVEALIADVSSMADVDNAVANFRAGADGIDTLVAAAGVARGGLVHRMSEAAWDQVIDVNLKGTFLLARAGIPLLQRRGGGVFVAISSDAGLMGSVAYGAYCASKHGVIGFVKSMALGAPARHSAAVPIGRFARAEEVANVVAHLTSTEASYTNGNVYLVDGGSSAGHVIGQD